MTPATRTTHACNTNFGAGQRLLQAGDFCLAVRIGQSAIQRLLQGKNNFVRSRRFLRANRRPYNVSIAADRPHSLLHNDNRFLH